MCAGKAIRALQPVLAGKSFGDIDLIGGQDIHEPLGALDALTRISMQRLLSTRLALRAAPQQRFDRGRYGRDCQ